MVQLNGTFGAQLVTLLVSGYFVNSEFILSNDNSNTKIINIWYMQGPRYGFESGGAKIDVTNRLKMSPNMVGRQRKFCFLDPLELPLNHFSGINQRMIFILQKWNILLRNTIF